MLVLFDIDGTLILTGGAGLRALDKAFRDVLGLERACAGFSAGGKTDPGIVDEVVQKHLGRTATATEIVAVLDSYVQHLREEVARTERYQIMPGVFESLAVLGERGATVGLATGNIERGARIKLERGDLWRRFPFGGYGSDDGDRGRLVAKGIERGARHAGRSFKPDEVLVIGDTPRDVAAAHACGAVAVGVATGGDSTDVLRASGADVVFETLDELPAWLTSR